MRPAVTQIALVVGFVAMLFCSAFGQQAWLYPPVFDDATEYVYKVVDDIQLKTWVFQSRRADDASDRPAVVFFFGGGWKAGTPAQFAEQCRYLSSRGVVAITCDYRVAGRHGVKAVACVEDAKSAIRWVRTNAKMLGVNPRQICAAGGSAGGHIACCTGVIPDLDAVGENAAVSSVPDAMALFNPAVMLAALQDGSEVRGFGNKLAGMKERTGVDPIRVSPIHHLKKGQPPAIIFHGTADSLVSFASVEEFTRRSSDFGNDITLVPYDGAPHGFFNHRGESNPRGDNSLQWFRSTVEQLDRFLARLGWINGEPTERSVGGDMRIRRYLDRSRHQFEANNRGRVAFLGGSITEMNGYRPLVESWLQRQFPQSEFDFINAGISSTCSHTGAFRFRRDVLCRGPVDLLFVEFAVNDDQDAGHSGDDCIRGMEGVIRQALASHPGMDIVMVHFVNESMLQTIQNGGEPLSSQRHESVARRYGVSSVYLSRHVARAIQAGHLTWKNYGGTHPGPAGNELAAKLVCQLLEQGWRSGCPLRESENYTLPPLIDETSFTRGRLVSAADAEVTLSPNWQRSVPDWKRLPGSKRKRFLNEVMLHTEGDSGALSYQFDGVAIGAYLLAGPDTGTVRYRIDNGEWQTMDLLHRHSKRLHYPRTVMFGVGLVRGQHLLELKTQPVQSAERGGAVRILAFAVDD